MEYRNLGRTGVKVSPLCLGAMMFGQWGNRDHDDSVRIIHAALDAGINFVDTELFGAAWRFAPGHKLQLEIPQVDATYFRADNFSSAALVSGVRLELPLA